MYGRLRWPPGEIWVSVDHALHPRPHVRFSEDAIDGGADLRVVVAKEALQHKQPGGDRGRARENEEGNGRERPRAACQDARDATGR